MDESLEESLSYSAEYAEWLMKNELVWNGDRLVDLQEKQHRFDEFLAQRKS